jgi:hypothetical protein
MSGGGQPGNQNARKGRMWTEAIKRALQSEASRHGETLEERMSWYAAKLLETCASEDLAIRLSALKELGDRIEGKVKPAPEEAENMARTLTEILLEMANARRPTPAAD